MRVTPPRGRRSLFEAFLIVPGRPPEDHREVGHLPGLPRPGPKGAPVAGREVAVGTRAETHRGGPGWRRVLSARAPITGAPMVREDCRTR